MKKILVINLGWEQEPLLDKLSNYDIDIYGVHYDENYYKNPKYKDILIANLRNLDSILSFAKAHKIDAVISDECDYSYFAQAVIAENLNLPGPRVIEAQIATNKYLQRQKAKDENLLIPEFKLCLCLEDIYQFVKEIGFPIITKPIDNRGSFGVNKITSMEKIEEAFMDALINSHSRLVIAEKFIEGVHITVDGYIFRNKGPKSLAVAQKKLTSENDGVQVAIDIQYPAKFERSIYKEILKTNEHVNHKLGFNFGMTHSEYMVTKDNKIYLIESANRGGGVYTSSIIVPSVTNIDIVEQYICDTLKIEKTYFQDDIKENSIVLKFFNLLPGEIKEISGIEDLEKKEEILKLRLLIKKGDIIQKITTDANRHGFVIARNNAINLDEEIIKHIRVCYEK